MGEMKKEHMAACGEEEEEEGGRERFSSRGTRETVELRPWGSADASDLFIPPIRSTSIALAAVSQTEST